MTTVPTTIQEQIALAPPRGEGGEGPSLSAADIAAILKHRLVMIIALWLLFSTMGVGLFFLAYFKFPTYRATAFIECISDLPMRPGEFDVQMTEDRHERFVASHAMFASSPRVLDAALEAPEVRKTDWYGQADKRKLRLELEEDLGSSPVRDTNYFAISMGCRSLGDPAAIVNQVVASYIEKVRSRGADAYRAQLASYKSEQATLQKQITQKLRQVQNFVSTLEPGAIHQGAQYGPSVMEILDRQKEVARLELQTLELESFVNIYQDPTGPGVTVEDAQAVEADPRVISLDNQVSYLEQELDMALHDLGSEHRTVRAMRIRMEMVRRQAAEVRGLRLQEILKFKAEQVESAFLTSQHSLLVARERLTEARAKQADLERKLAEHETLKDELAMLKDTKARLDDVVQEVERVVRDQTAVRVDVAQPAVDPLQRSSPRFLLLPVAVIFALGLAIAVAVGLELLDTSVRTPQDIVRHLSLPLLGTVPDMDDEEVDIEVVETAVRVAPHSMVAEAFRTIRTNLQFSAPSDRQRTLLVTSPRPEDGKTVISCNIATSIALTGRRVLLVDANLRRPALHRVFSSINQAGLSNFLIGGAKLDELICKTEIANLDVVGSGPMPPNPAELLNGALGGEFLEQAQSRYDQVIIDTPPVLLASDALVLATRVEGVILVCRAKDNSRGQAQRALSLLDRVNASVFGGILNCAQVRRGGYFREQLRTFYEYQEEEEGGVERVLSTEPAKEIATDPDPEPGNDDTQA
ncbi:MAG: polysaccharide biosynthesis tyrosine autokinase [bacterium]|nr:polysaccharide biosynthesis tyrosine autokinase [bacterium]